jgi:hypothetical protein
MDEHLPSDPLPGQVVKVPDGIEAGDAVHVLLYTSEGNVLGESQRLSNVENVSRKWQLGRTVCSSKLAPEDVIHLRAERRPFDTLIFVEYFGWVGHTYRNAEVIREGDYEVLYAAPYSLHAKADIHVYELVCLSKIEGEDDGS